MNARRRPLQDMKPSAVGLHAKPDRYGAVYILIDVRIARYWARDEAEITGPDGGRLRIRTRGWSGADMAGARERARDIARRIGERILAGGRRRHEYGYAQRPLPEPVLREFAAEGSPGYAILTRNAYGALVLNTDNLMFVDIDNRDAPRWGIPALFGKSSAVPDRVRKVVERHGLCARIYQTAAGHRVLIAKPGFEPGGEQAEALLKEFGSDPLFIQLCRLQQSFRARLTPKPWRCGWRNPPVTFPYETAADEAKFREWEAGYNRKSQAYATCRFLGQAGAGAASPGFAGLIDYHDQETKAASGLPLA
jgi:hypothetical protein